MQFFRELSSPSWQRDVNNHAGVLFVWLHFNELEVFYQAVVSYHSRLLKTVHNGVQNSRGVTTEHILRGVNELPERLTGAYRLMPDRQLLLYLLHSDIAPSGPLLIREPAPSAGDADVVFAALNLRRDDDSHWILSLAHTQPLGTTRRRRFLGRQLTRFGRVLFAIEFIPPLQGDSEGNALVLRKPLALPERRAGILHQFLNHL